MFEKVSEEEVKAILRHKTEKIANIHSKMKQLYMELESVDNIIYAAAMPKIRNDGMPGVKGGQKDFVDLIDNYRKQYYEQSVENRRIMCVLAEKEKQINRVWACFYALDDPCYSILKEIYVENQLYQAVESSFDMSHKTFERYRQEGIKTIIRYYESGKSIAELMLKERMQTGAGKKVKKEKKKADYAQMDITAYLMEEGADMREKEKSG